MIKYLFILLYLFKWLELWSHILHSFASHVILKQDRFILDRQVTAWVSQETIYLANSLKNTDSVRDVTSAFTHLNEWIIQPMHS